MAIKVSISNGNAKMGAIPSVSLPPVTTCAPGCACAGKCYAAKLCRLRPSVRAAYERNLEALNDDWPAYWAQVRAAAMCTRFFRFHVSGDIPNAAYFKEMVITARQNPGTEFLAFTKRYDIVNNYLDAFGSLPANLHTIFSAWPGMDMTNPHGLPVAHVVFRGEQPRDDWKICGGNCTDCACRGVGCWQLQRGEHIAFNEH
jgi:hypothetical protein